MPWPILSRRRATGALLVAPVTLALGSGSREGLRASLARSGGGPDIVDNAPALRSALQALAAGGGGVLDIGAGVHRIASTSLGQAGVALPGGIVLRGAGVGRTIIRVTGETPCNLFVADGSHIAVEGLTLVGNNAAPVLGAYGIGAAIRWALGPAARADAIDFALRDVHLENFRGPFWVDIENAAEPERRLAMRGIALERVTFTSRPGNSVAPGDLRYNAAAVCISGYGGEVGNVRVTGLSGDARHIKSGIILYHQVIDAVLDGVTVAAAGVAGAGDDAGGYGIQLYDSHYRMRNVTVSNAVVTAPRSAGIYVAGGIGIAIVAPRISGQTDTRAGTLPKGAVVFNGTRDWRLTDARFSGNWRDIDIAAPDRGTAMAPERIGGRVSGVRSEGSSTGVAIRTAAGRIAADVRFSDCRWRTTGRTVLVQNGADGHVDDVLFEDCRLEAGEGARAIDLWGVDGASGAGGYRIVRCTLIGSNPLYARGQGGSLVVEGCTIADRGTSDGASAATLIDCPLLDLRDCTLRSPGRSGIGIDLGGSTGAVRRLRFVDCTTALPARLQPIQLGRGRPAFRGRAAQHVQNLEPAPGAPAGWTCAGGLDWRGLNATD